MEEVSQTIDQMKQIKKDKNDINNTKNWKKNIKFKETCEICGKEFEYEDIPKNPMEAIRWERGWDRPQRYFCSEECRKINMDRKKVLEYKKRLKILPIRFRQIECDKKNMVEEGINQSLFITGASGVGKTVLMAGIVKELLKSTQNKVKWISYPGFIMELQSMYSKKDNEETPFEMAERIATFEGTLCIDDIGAEKTTAFVQQITYYIINYREQEMLHTLITSNFSLQQIDEQIDTRISSRLGGTCKVIKLTGGDRRLLRGDK